MTRLKRRSVAAENAANGDIRFGHRGSVCAVFCRVYRACFDVGGSLRRGEASGGGPWASPFGPGICFK